jgi:class 3 adenylate cyclase/CHASE2 domain-containing sensor protein
MAVGRANLAGAGIAMTALGLAIGGQLVEDRLSVFQFVQRLEWLSYDWRMRQATQRAQPLATKLAFVGIDDDSLYWLGEGRLLGEPYGLLWPRHIYGRLVRELHAQGAQAVALDILFGELRPDHPPVQLPDGKRVDSDQFFAEQLRQASNVILAAEQEVVPALLFQTNALAIGDISHTPDADGVLRRVPAFKTYRLWNPLFRQLAHKYNCKLVLEPRQVQFLHPATGQPQLIVPIDAEGYFRWEDLTGHTNSGLTRLERAYTLRRVWHMGIVLAAVALGLDVEQALIEPGRIILQGPGGVRRVIPLDSQNRFYINWRVLPNDPRLVQANIEHLLLQDLLRQTGQTDSLTNRFGGALVTVGSAATGSNLTDLGATPLVSRTLLASTHWNVANMLISGQFIRPATRSVSLLLTLALWAIAVGLNGRLSVGWATAAMGLVLAGFGAGATWVFVCQNYWIPIVWPAGAGLLLTHIGLVSWRAVFEQSEQRRVKRLFAKLVAPSVVQELLRTERLALGGARRDVTVFFADVRGFTELTDRRQSEAEVHVRSSALDAAAAAQFFDQQARELLETVNLYLDTVARTVKAHAGTLDKYIGDCVMAFWGAPTPQPHHAAAAARAAVAVQQAIQKLNQSRTEENQRRAQENQRRAALGQEPWPLLEVLQIGCSLNTGMVTVGLMGSDAHLLNYTVFGHAVNVASRLETLAAPGQIILGETTYQHLTRDDPALAARCRELPPVSVKGVRGQMRLFELLWQSCDGQAAEPQAAQRSSVAP